MVVCPFGHCVVCPSIYEFRLPLWYLQTLIHLLLLTRVTLRVLLGKCVLLTLSEHLSSQPPVFMWGSYCRIFISLCSVLPTIVFMFTLFFPLFCLFLRFMIKTFLLKMQGRRCRVCSHWIYNYLCNQCLSLLKLRVRISLIVRCT